MRTQVEVVQLTNFDKGLYTGANVLQTQKGQSPACMDVKWNFDQTIQKRYGASTQNTLSLGSTAAVGWTIVSSSSLSTNLSAYWKLDEVSGSRLDQFNGKDLSDFNSTGSLTGIRGAAALFAPSSGNYLYRASESSLDASGNNLSLSAWIYLNSTSNTIERPIISKQSNAGGVDSYTKLLLHCDGVNGSTTFNDSSGNSHSATAVGGAQVDTSQQKFGSGSCKLDGSADYLTIPDSTDFNFGTEDFTIDFWVRFNTIKYGWMMDLAGMVTIYLYNGSFVWSVGTYAGTADIFAATAPVINTWYHVAVVRASNILKLYINGKNVGSSTYNRDIDTTGNKFIGEYTSGGGFSTDGWMDEIRISKGIARWTSDFTVPSAPYGTGSSYEYYLYVNTNNFVTFRTSNNGSSQTASVEATSFGAINTSTWYNVVAWISSSNHIGVSVNLNANTLVTNTICLANSASFMLGANSGDTVNYMDGRIDEVGVWKKVLTSAERINLYGGGTANTYSSGQSGYTWGMFDFGASSNRWLLVAAGSGIYASSNLGSTFTSVSTSRTSNYQTFERSKNVVIATSYSYDPTLYWSGSSGTFFQTLAPNSAPAAKFAINHQGFLILLNYVKSDGTLRKRGFSYSDESLQLTSAWNTEFDIPSSADDENTSAFVINRVLYVSTKYTIYRVSFVGGNPDWSYEKVKTWGFVPRTVKVTTIEGQNVAIGLDWSRRIRVFDGFNDYIISSNVEADNNLSEFAMSKVSLQGSGLQVSHAELDLNEQEYRLNIAIGTNTSQTTHSVLLNLRSLSIYPYSNQQHQAMCMAESDNKLFLLACDRSGYVHILNTGNLDVSAPINEYYLSPYVFKGNPGVVSKGAVTELYFQPGSCGTVYYEERANFSKNKFAPVKEMKITDDGTVNQLVFAQDVVSVHNQYQFLLTSSANRANPWKLTHAESYFRQSGYGKA